MTVSRVLLPTAGEYRKNIEQWISVSVGQPVSIEALEAEWHGFGPRLKMINVNVFDDKHEKLVTSLKEARVGIDLLGSLLNGQIELEDLTVSGASLSVSHLEDGSIVVQGLSLNRQQVSPSRRNNRLLQWMFSQDSIAIEASEFVWRDIVTDKQLQFSNVNLELRNAGSRHQFDGSAALPVSMGRRIAFAFDITGDVLKPRGWSGKGYINGGGLHIDSLIRDREISGIHVDRGTAEVRLWSEWKNARLVRLEGMMSSLGTELSSVNIHEVNNDAGNQNDVVTKSGSYKADTLSGKFVWQREESGWMLAVDDFVLGREGRLWPFSNFSVRLSGKTESPDIYAKASYLHMADIRDLLLASNLPATRLREALAALEPKGDLYDTYIEFRGGDNSSERINIASRFENVAVKQWGKLPGIQGLTGRVKGNGRSGTVEFVTSSAQVELTPMFRGPIPITKLDGSIAWLHSQGQWRLSGDEITLNNDDLAVKAGMDMEIPDDGTAPFVALDVNFSGTPGSVAQTSRYLPVTVIPNTTRWLDRSIIGGTITGGTFVFNGRVNQFPFSHDEGKFDVRFNVTDGILDYVQDWPRIEGIEAEVHFFGNSMEINAVAGKSLDSEVTEVQARIANLRKKPAVLEIEGKAQGPTLDVLRYINETPLASKFGRYLKDVTATGNSHLDLKLTRRLAKGEPVRLAGALRLEDSGLELADGRVDMSNINGVLQFTESTISAENINARLLGLESIIDVETRQEQQITATYITAKGKADEKSIAGLLDIPLLKNLIGNTHWTAWLRIPKTSGKEPALSNLHIESDLQGLAINLPEPLKKDKDESRRLVIETGLPRSLDKLIDVSLGDIISANFDVDDDMRVERGEIHLGEGIAPFPERNGIHVSGKWSRLSLDEWLPLIKSKKTASQSPAAAVVNDLDIYIENVEAFERPYHKVKLEASRGADMWRVVVTSDELKGIIQLPFDPDAILVMDLDYLHLAKQENKKGKDQTDPRNIPVVRINSKSFSYDGLDFGSLDLTASRHPAGIHLDSLKLVSPTTNVNARGDWVAVNGEHYSSFNITFNSDNLGNTLAGWGYAGSIKKGSSTFDIVARWPGPPTSFALERLDGSLHLKITDGRLLDIDPGAGRIFGLISLQALPRRLSLDFSDIFQKGFSFDRIEGDFALAGGNATTKNLIMDGPAARIEAQGRIGLDTRDYDQVVTVNPNVTSSLPVAGAVVGGVGVGAAILFAQKLLEPEIDKATRIKYSVTGPWDNPVITRIDEKQPAANDVKGQKR